MTQRNMGAALAGKIDQKLEKLGIRLPDASGAKANYVAWRRSGNLVFIAGQGAFWDGDLDRVVRCVKLGGFVHCTPDFTDQPKVINGASDLMVEVFGDAGKHARFAVGAWSLPMGTSVEIDGIFEIS